MSKCQTCNEDFSEEFRIPKVLPCGHTYCLICIYGLFQKHKVFICQDCSYPIKDPRVIEKLPNNKTLLAFIQQYKAQKFMDDSASNFFSNNSSNPFLDTQDSINFSPNSFDAFKNMSPQRQNQLSDSFNFDPFKSFLEDNAQYQNRSFQKSFTEPRKGRNKSPPKKIKNIEITDKGIFREKTPPRVVEVCNIKMCNNEKMYYKGSLQPFCSFHCAQQNNSIMIDEFQNARLFKGHPEFPNSELQFKNIAMTTSQPYHPNFSQPQPEKKSPFEFLSPQPGSEKQGPMFGRATAMKKLMQFYEQTPARTPGNDSLNTTNSSVFSSFAPKENASVDFGHAVEKNLANVTPFPEIPVNNNLPNEDRCIIPGCQNQKLVLKGIKYPVCSRKCYAKSESAGNQMPFGN